MLPAQHLKHTTGVHHFVNIANKKQFFNISNQIVMVSDRLKPKFSRNRNEPKFRLFIFATKT